MDFDTRSIGYTTPRTPRRSGLGAIPSAGAGGTSGVTAPVSSQVNWGGIGRGVVDFLGPIAEEEIRRRLQGRGGSAGGGGGGGGCTPPLVRDPTSGVCLFPGSPGEASVTDVTDVTMPDSGIGPLGLFAQPTVVGEIQGQPIRRCPRGLVLARDNMCYSKKDLPNRFRKHPKRKKAKISAYDWKMMNRYGPGGSKQQKAKEMAQAAGFSCSYTAKGKPKKRAKK